jgi:hypothetical protein
MCRDKEYPHGGALRRFNFIPTVADQWHIFLCESCNYWPLSRPPTAGRILGDHARGLCGVERCALSAGNGWDSSFEMALGFTFG